jgi:hypothetical protein
MELTKEYFDEQLKKLATKEDLKMTRQKLRAASKRRWIKINIRA